MTVPKKNYLTDCLERGAQIDILVKNLLPNMSIPVFALKELPFGEAFKTEGRDVHCLWGAVKDEFDEAGPRSGGGLEAGAA